MILIKFSKESNVEGIWFQFLYQLNEIDPLETHELLFIFNFLLNLTTNGEYYTRIESKLFCNSMTQSNTRFQSQQNINQFSFPSFNKFTIQEKVNSECFQSDVFILNRIDHYDRNKDVNTIIEQYLIKYSRKTQKFKINMIWFLDVLIRALFEIVSDRQIKKLYLCILHDFIKISNYNLAFLSNDSISLKFLLYFRYEEDTEVRKKISLILTDILKANSKVSHIRVLSSMLKSPLEVSEILKSTNLISIFQDKELLKIKSKNMEIMSDSLRELFYMIINIVEFSKSNLIQKETLCFSGNSSGMILKNFNSFPSTNFSIICQIKFENLMPFKKKFSVDYKKSLKHESFMDGFCKRSFNFIKPHQTRVSELKKPISDDKVIEVEIKLLDQKKEENAPDIQKYSYLSKDTPKKYRPILFSLFSSSESYLEIFLEDQKSIFDSNVVSNKLTCKDPPKKYLKIRFVNTKKEKNYEQSFLHDFKEEEWYDLAISFQRNPKNKNFFEVFLNGIEIMSNDSSGEMLGEYLDEFKCLNLFSIGCSPPAFLKTNNAGGSSEKNIDLSDCFCGELKNLLILDLALNLEGSKKVLKKLKEEMSFGEKPEKTSNQIYSNKNIIMSLDDFTVLADIKMGFDFVWFEIKNKNEIKFLELDKYIQEKIVTEQAQSSKNNNNLFTKFLDIFKFNKPNVRKNKQYNDFKIYTKEVTFIEKNTFFEILFINGNMDVLLYIFEIILSKENKFDSEAKY